MKEDGGALEVFSFFQTNLNQTQDVPVDQGQRLM
jgi:hypothetical protein